MYLLLYKSNLIIIYTLKQTVLITIILQNSPASSEVE